MELVRCLPGVLFNRDKFHLNAYFLVLKISFSLLGNYTYIFLGCEFFEGQDVEAFSKCADE